MTDIDAAHDELFRKKQAADDHSQKSDQRVRIDNRTQIATPVAIAAIVCFFIAGLLGGLALGMAHTAEDVAGQARMEARLAQEDLIMLRAAVRASGIHVETAKDHD